MKPFSFLFIAFAFVYLLQACGKAGTPLVTTDKQSFLMSVEDVFFLTNRGTMATGLIERGVIKVGDNVEIVGMMKDGEKPMTSTVTGIERSYKKPLERGVAGDHVGLFLRGIDKTAIHRGMVICAPGSAKAHKKFKCEVYVLNKEEGGRHIPFSNGYRPQFHFRTTDITGDCVLPADLKTVMPGDSVTLEVSLIQSVALEKNLSFDMREGGRTVGKGQVTEILD